MSFDTSQVVVWDFRTINTIGLGEIDGGGGGGGGGGAKTNTSFRQLNMSGTSFTCQGRFEGTMV